MKYFQNFCGETSWKRLLLCERGGDAKNKVKQT
jgi:hypothetical protein